MGRRRIYTDEERKERQREQARNWNRKHRPQKVERKLNIELVRANNLLSAYNQSDRQHSRGKGDLTGKWILENIFTKSCAYCGKEGWDIMGCNRLDNTKPHSKDNVEPCCKECNKKLKRKTVCL